MLEYIWLFIGNHKKFRKPVCFASLTLWDWRGFCLLILPLQHLYESKKVHLCLCSTQQPFCSVMWKGGWEKRLFLLLHCLIWKFSCQPNPCWHLVTGCLNGPHNHWEIAGWKKGKMGTSCSCKSVLTCVSKSLFFGSPG